MRSSHVCMWLSPASKTGNETAGTLTGTVLLARVVANAECRMPNALGMLIMLLGSALFSYSSVRTVHYCSIA
jgi:hypothetical protein